jgi:ABC-type cobalamin/Fe3+-siderophores transport system ATPase subunit
VALLHGGGLVANGPPDATITSAAMRLLYGVEVEIAEIADARGALHRVCLPAR